MCGYNCDLWDPLIQMAMSRPTPIFINHSGCKVWIGGYLRRHYDITVMMFLSPQSNKAMDTDFAAFALLLGNNLHLESPRSELETRNRQLEDEIESLRLWCQSCESRADDGDKQRQENEQVGFKIPFHYRKVSNIRHTLVGNKILDHSDVVGASPVGVGPTICSFSTSHPISLD